MRNRKFARPAPLFEKATEPDDRYRPSTIIKIRLNGDSIMEKTGNPLLAVVQNVNFDDDEEYKNLVKRATLLRLLSISRSVTMAVLKEYAIIEFDICHDELIEGSAPEYVTRDILRYIQDTSEGNIIVEFFQHKYEGDDVVTRFIGHDKPIIQFKNRALRFDELLDNDVSGFFFSFKNLTHRSLYVYKDFEVATMFMQKAKVWERHKELVPLAPYAMEFIYDYRRFTSSKQMDYTHTWFIDVELSLFGLLEDKCHQEAYYMVAGMCFPNENPYMDDSEIRKVHKLTPHHEYMKLMNIVNNTPDVLGIYFNRVADLIDKVKAGDVKLPYPLEYCNPSEFMEELSDHFNKSFPESMVVWEIADDLAIKIPRERKWNRKED